uniref:Uncharacterized protein n=1 Tax=Anguilla anguilla TaxID=7936 RepID=A0A0E9WC21_ANGAN
MSGHWVHVLQSKCSTETHQKVVWSFKRRAIILAMKLPSYQSIKSSGLAIKFVLTVPHSEFGKWECRCNL